MDIKASDIFSFIGKEQEPQCSSYLAKDMITELKETQRKIRVKDIKSVKALKEAIFRVSKELWKGNNPYEDNLKQITLVHSYLINEVIQIHHREESYINQGFIRDNISIKPIINQVEDGKRSSKIYLFNDDDYEYYYIGDIHSDNYILDVILEKIEFFSKMINNKKVRIIFLGDYIDRGREHLKTMERILILKYIFPGNIYLLSGNHDGGNFINDEVRLSIRKPEKDKDEDYFLLYLHKLSKKNPSMSKEVIKKYIELFQSMALLSFSKVGGKIICGVHGGIPRPLRGSGNIYGYIHSLYDLTDEAKVNIRGESIVSNLLWSDPLEEELDKYEHTRRFGFKEGEFNAYADLIGIDILIRGHQANEEGYKSFFKERLYCIFGSGAILNYSANINPSTAYPWVKPKIIKVEKNNFINIIDLNSK